MWEDKLNFKHSIADRFQLWQIVYQMLHGLRLRHTIAIELQEGQRQRGGN